MPGSLCHSVASRPKGKRRTCGHVRLRKSVSLRSFRWGAALHCSIENPAAFIQEDALEIHLEGLWVAGFAQGFPFTHLALFNQVVERLVEVDHPVVSPGLDRGCKLVQPV